MMLTRSRLTPASRADLTTFKPSAVSPSGSTGSVSEIFRPGFFFCSAASAFERLRAPVDRRLVRDRGALDVEVHERQLVRVDHGLVLGRQRVDVGARDGELDTRGAAEGDLHVAAGLA